MSRTGCAAQRPRMRGAARRLPGPVALLPAGMRKGRAANTVRPARQQGPPRRRPEPDGVPGRRCPGTQPAPGGRPGGRRTRRLGRPGVLRPVTYCPPGRPPCRPPPGNFADSRAGHPAGPGMAPAQGPCPGGVRIRGPAAPGGEASSPGPQVPLPRRYAAGGPAGSGPCCPNPGQTVNNPPCQPARAVLPQRTRPPARLRRARHARAVALPAAVQVPGAPLTGRPLVPGHRGQPPPDRYLRAPRRAPAC